MAFCFFSGNLKIFGLTIFCVLRVISFVGFFSKSLISIGFFTSLNLWRTRPLLSQRDRRFDLQATGGKRSDLLSRLSKAWANRPKINANTPWLSQELLKNLPGKLRSCGCSAVSHRRKVFILRFGPTPVAHQGSGEASKAPGRLLGKSGGCGSKLQKAPNRQKET